MVTTAVYAVGFAVAGGSGIVVATVLTILVGLIRVLAACLRITKSRAALWTCMAYPWIAIAFLDTTWGAAWIKLGHGPLPGRDDPQRISEVVSFLHAATSVFFVSGPLALLAMVLLIIVEAVPITDRAGVPQLTVIPWLILAPIGSWSGALVLLGLEPGRVLNWFLD